MFGSLQYKECINLKEDDKSLILDKIRNSIQTIEKMLENVKTSNEIIKEKMDTYSNTLEYILEKCNNEKK